MPTPILPSSPAPHAIKISVKSRSVISQAESGKILGRAKGIAYYEMALIYPPMRRDQFGPIHAFLEANARPNIFYVQVDPMTGTAGEIVGNHINFDNDTKLHLITSISPSTAVTPPMRNVGGLIISNPVYMRCSLKNDVQQISLGKDGLVRFEINLVERI